MSSHFEYHHLSGIVPEGMCLAVNLQKGILTLLPAGIQILEQTIASDQEMMLILALLGQFPAYCPNEVLLSAFTGDSIRHCRELIHQAMEEGTAEGALRPLYNRLSRCRLKLKPLGINLSPIVGTGYMMMPVGQDKYGLAKSGKEGQ